VKTGRYERGGATKGGSVPVGGPGLTAVATVNAPRFVPEPHPPPARVNAKPTAAAGTMRERLKPRATGGRYCPLVRSASTIGESMPLPGSWSA
jgi:hypothetical protein